MQRSVLITGCSDGGLGAALALAFQDAGFRVIATARNPSKMAAMKARNIETVQLDVLSDASIQAAAREVAGLLDGRLDVLVNNAGGGYSMPVLDIDVAAIRALFDLNVFSVIPMSRHFFPLLRASPHGAVIANNTSIAGLLPIPVQGAYNASKAALALLTQNMRLELQPFGIRVVDLKTGAVRTNFFANVAGSATGGPQLPATSPYVLAKDEFESRMAGEGLMDGAVDADVWARDVVAKLARKTPPLLIWSGGTAFITWLAGFLPLWLLDGQLKDLMGINLFAKRLRAEQAGVKRA